ncbi:MAG: ABC transporter substrate-binding protein [Lachnospiraceae bacterium]
MRRFWKTIMWCCLVVLSLCCTACKGTNADNPQTEAEQICDQLTFEQRMPLSYAKEFTVDCYKDGYRLLTISDGSQFLVVPEGKKTPSDLNDSVQVLQQPLSHIYLVASATMDMFRALDALDTISLSGTQAENWYIPEAKQAMETGKIAYAGKYNAPDYEKIVDDGCSLSIQSTMILHSPEVKEKLESFQIPVLVDYSSYEKHPLGRCEWVKLYGALLGKEKEAEAAFEEQAQAVKAITEKKTDKTVAFFYITTNEAVSVRKSGDYVPKMIELAGGNYIFSNLGGDESASSSVTLQMEEFYAKAKDADYLIYNSTIAGKVETLSQLLEKSALLKEFKAVKNKHVWCTSQNLYQDSMEPGTMITDLHTILTKEDAADEDTTYLFRLQ